MSITVNDGQVGTAAAAIIPVGSPEGRYSATFQNTSASLTEIVLVTFTRSGGSSRRVARAILAPNEQLVITGMPVGTGDAVLASTTDATTVDFVVAVSGASTLEIISLDANGVRKGATSATSFTGAITSSAPTGGGIGYATGAGGAVSQATDRTTGVTLSKLSGQITTQATSLAAAALVSFTVTNTTVAIGDTIILSIQSGPTTVGTIAYVTTVAAGSFQITLKNLHAATADTGAAIINFAVIKSVAA